MALGLVDLNKLSIVSERTSNKGVRVLLAVDADDTVREIDIGLPDTNGEATVAANLGARITVSGKAKLSKVLPKDKVATLAKRVTLKNGMTIHVVIAWGFTEFQDMVQPWAYLYVFQEHHGEATQFSVDKLGTELRQFIVEDINGDGKVEVLAVVRDNSVETMYVWQIQQDGDLREIQRIEGYGVHTQADRFMGQGLGIILERKVQNSATGEFCYPTEEYVWSVKQQQFVKR